uniref:Uncharacterized protein n=1 Tax=Lotharella globosa TaxID=91324 RepID=A0A7S4DNK8_9EUKA|mmetsp:Transcript_18024/g.36372  ORF Transcript_18024/g.36372 Transcript_18024/m.36372 type:complete len:142 (-) Transcript_18024:34-459(-)
MESWCECSLRFCFFFFVFFFKLFWNVLFFARDIFLKKINKLRDIQFSPPQIKEMDGIISAIQLALCFSLREIYTHKHINTFPKKKQEKRKKTRKGKKRERKNENLKRKKKRRENTPRKESFTSSCLVYAIEPNDPDIHLWS